MAADEVVRRAEADAEAGDSEEMPVRVAVVQRPLLHHELIESCSECTFITPGEPQVVIGPKSFTFDYVYGGIGRPLDALFGDCVDPLVQGIFQGYNATVFAYGQTGSGKTHTMGTSYTAGGAKQGVIPNVMDTVFGKVAGSEAGTDITVKVRYIEIHKEEIRDLLVMDQKTACPISVREVPDEGIILVGARDQEVSSQEDMAQCLEQGALCRATASTSMNSRSSRSHAIFTITVEQKRRPEDEGAASPGKVAGKADYLLAKLHLVDLAGSERAKRTKAEGKRFKEGVQINKGLLALGNVISALGDEKRRAAGAHVPYRDSKLTRLLQDSLGGNSRTVMIACISPADINMCETLNTLKYANRARNIRNKPTVNCDAASSEISALRQQLAAARAEALALRGGGALPGDALGAGGGDPAAGGRAGGAAVAALEQAVAEAQREAARLRVELAASVAQQQEGGRKLLQAERARDELRLRIERARGGDASALEEDGGEDEDGGMGVVECHLVRIQELENEVTRLQHLREAGVPDGSPMALGAAEGAALEDDDEAKGREAAWRQQQEAIGSELQALDGALQAKEAQMHRMQQSESEMSALKNHYDRVLGEMEAEKGKLQDERTGLVRKLQALSSSAQSDHKKAAERYKTKLESLEVKLGGLKKQLSGHAQLVKMKSRSDDAAKRLSAEILRMKQARVALVRRLEEEHRTFHEWKQAREKELMQLRRQERRTNAEKQKLESLHARQQQVLKRKTEEAAAASKRLKEVLHGRAQLRRPASASSERAMLDWVERELEGLTQVPDIRRVLGVELARRKELAGQLAELNAALDKAETPGEGAGAGPRVAWGDAPAAAEEGPSAAELRERRAAVQGDIKERSAQVKELQAALVAAEEKARAGAEDASSRWAAVKTLAEARSALRHLFDAAAGAITAHKEAEAAASDSRAELEVKQIELEEAMDERRSAERAAAAAERQLRMLEAARRGGRSTPGRSPAGRAMRASVLGLMPVPIAGMLSPTAPQAAPRAAPPPSEVDDLLKEQEAGLADIRSSMALPAGGLKGLGGLAGSALKGARKIVQEAMSDDESEEESEGELSDDESDDDSEDGDWDIRLGTPAPKAARRRREAEAGEDGGEQGGAAEAEEAKKAAEGGGEEGKGAPVRSSAVRTSASSQGSQRSSRSGSLLTGEEGVAAVQEAFMAGRLSTTTVPQLKVYLSAAGLKVSGKKAELLQRVEGHIEEEQAREMGEAGQEGVVAEGRGECEQEDSVSPSPSLSPSEGLGVEDLPPGQLLGSPAAGGGTPAGLFRSADAVTFKTPLPLGSGGGIGRWRAGSAGGGAAWATPTSAGGGLSAPLMSDSPCLASPTDVATRTSDARADTHLPGGGGVPLALARPEEQQQEGGQQGFPLHAPSPATLAARDKAMRMLQSATEARERGAALAARLQSALNRRSSRSPPPTASEEREEGLEMQDMGGTPGRDAKAAAPHPTRSPLAPVSTNTPLAPAVGKNSPAAALRKSTERGVARTALEDQMAALEAQFNGLPAAAGRTST